MPTIYNVYGERVIEYVGCLKNAIVAHPLHSFDDLLLDEVDLSGCILEGACFAGASLHKSCFDAAILYWANFFHANLRDASFVGAEMRGGVLDEACFIGANLTDARLGEDNLGGYSTALGTDLRCTGLDKADLCGMRYSETTQFPEGFSPESHGMKLQSE